MALTPIAVSLAQRVLFIGMEILVELNQRQMEAAHQLGEAILRFVRAIEIPKQMKDVPDPAQRPLDSLDDRLLRVSEAAEILSLGKSMIYGLICSGRLPSVKIGSARRLKLSEVLKLLEGVE